MHTRIICTWVKQDESWQISMMHMSTPTEEQETEMFFPLHYGTDVVEKLSIDSGAKLLELVSKTLPGGIMGGYLEPGFPLYIINDKMLEILNYTYEELIAETNEKMLNIIYEEDREMVENSITEQLMGRNEYEVEYRTIGKNHRLIWVSDIGRKIITEDGRDVMISIMTDITDRKKREQKLQEEAEHDPLTGLFNRKKAMNLINMELQKESGGVLFVCDIDNFKRINDTKGHLAGDQVLLKLAEIIKEYADPQMAVTARLGGDEYILFFPGCLAEDEAEQNMRSIQQEFCTFIKEMIPELQISLSAGGAIWRSGEMFQNLYGRADAALYQAKQQKGDLKLG